MPPLGFKDSQIKALQKKAREEMSALNHEASSADRLIESFEQRKDVNYLYVTYRPDEGLLMMTRNKQKAILNLPNSCPDENLDTTLKELYKANNVKGEERLLLFFLNFVPAIPRLEQMTKRKNFLLLLFLMVITKLSMVVVVTFPMRRRGPLILFSNIVCHFFGDHWLQNDSS